MKKSFIRGALFSSGLLFSLAAAAQPDNTKTLTAADYQQAEKFMSYNTEPLVDRGNVRPNWIAGDRLWYRVLTAQGSEFILADPAKKTRTAAFDHTRLATALSAAAGQQYQANALPFSSLNFAPDMNAVFFTAGGKGWKCDIKAYSCALDTTQRRVGNGGGGFGGRGRGGAGAAGAASPDGKKMAFIRDYNLWVRDVAGGKETQLTLDGEKDYGYATDNAGWKKSDRPVVLWSPDGKKLATYKQDQRNVSDMYLVSTNVGKPRLEAWKNPLPGDKTIIMLERVIIDVDAPKVVKLQVAPDPRRSTNGDDITDGGALGDAAWNADASQLAFVSTSRDHRQEKFRIANAATGEVREVFEETVPTQFESGPGGFSWRFLAASNEILWYSERDNWGHLYLYDAATGKVKNQVTKGDWVVTDLVKVDEKNRVVYFIADGKEPGQNPYFNHMYKVTFDGKKLTALTPEEGNHQVALAPSGQYFVDSYSKPDVPPVVVVRNMDGVIVTPLEKTDVSRLAAADWKAPTPVTVKSRDGKTDLYGLMFTPTHLDAKKKYPIINYIYPGPQGGSITNWSFSSAVRDNQSLAELGFVVVSIVGSGNPMRSKSFHDADYGNIADNTLPDQIGGMKQLAEKYPFIDIDKAGIWGHSGGGFATAAAMLRYPDFFKVGISESGNHDNRNYEDDWGERYIGLLTDKGDGKSNYDDQANQNYAKNLKGKLMLAHGLMDDNVPPTNTLLVVDALIKANKDFDLVIFPNSRHGYGEFSNYMTRRRWDYFVRNLMGATPPPQYELKPKTDPRNANAGTGAGFGQ